MAPFYDTVLLDISYAKLLISSLLVLQSSPGLSYSSYIKPLPIAV